MKVGAAPVDANMSVDDLEVCDLRVLTFGYKVPAKGNVF
jgi:hypothetical protein